MTHDQPTIAILGGGHAAFAHAADLSIKGFEVRLFEVPEMAPAIAEVQRRGGIVLEPDPSTGLRGGYAQLGRVASDAGEALDGADIAFVVVPAFAQQAFARVIAPHVRSQQIVVLSPASFGGAITFAQALLRQDCRSLPYLCEAQSMIYACRKSGAASVRISGFKENLRVAVFPSRLTRYVMPRLNQVFPTLQAADNVLWTWLSNPNPIAHPPITILNTGWIEHTGGDFLFYLEGRTAAVGRVVEALDRERLAVGAALGLTLIPNKELTDLWYGHQSARQEIQGRTARELVYASIKAEKELDSRYLTEDIPYGLVPWEDLGKLVGVDMPICTALIDLGNSMLGRDFRQSGLTLERIGLGEMSVPQLRRLVEEGQVDACAAGPDFES